MHQNASRRTSTTIFVPLSVDTVVGASQTQGIAVRPARATMVPGLGPSDVDMSASVSAAQNSGDR